MDEIADGKYGTLAEHLHKDWEQDCLKAYGEILTGACCHWCYEWDGLPIDETCEEFTVCDCFKWKTCSAGGSVRRHHLI